MKILKASAGSGKTYRLSKAYRDLVLSSQDPFEYRHILAVTFTNKATAEMKKRILKDLNEDARTNPKAREVLVNILHDYGSFSISTIDKFFQRTLKAFSREIGQFADYQIELDKTALVSEAVDRVLDSLTEESTDLLAWIREGAEISLGNAQKFSPEEKLYQMCTLLKSEEHRRVAEQHSVEDAGQYSKEHLKALRRECRSVISSFEKQVKPYLDGYEPGKKIERPKVRAFEKLPSEIQDLFDRKYEIYATAHRIDSMIFSLGVAGEFYREYDRMLREKNLLCLDDSNSVLRDIIDGSDAPFVYEKLGVRYRHFLLDEFQDTSNIQWKNFLPLLLESESNGGSNLVVGDVKQCIYRFRDSDWDLLGSQIQKDIPQAVEEPLNGNWRSSRTVVDFNNRFFEFASRRLGLSDIYSDVAQTPMKNDPQPGMVQATFCQDQLAAVLGSIEEARKNHARYSDVAVLVRYNKHGSEIASFLIGNGIPVISDDSLKLKSSLTVRRLVSLLNCMENPGDSISRYLSESMGIMLPGSYHSVIDLCESLLRNIRDFDPQTFEGETLFIQAFMDELQAWTDLNGNDLRRFLERWKEKDPTIGSPENTDAVRVITIHKSKGLEYPYVIFPYADKVELYKSSVHWCYLDRFPELNGLYPVDLTKESEQTGFSESYAKERFYQLVDNINVLYVALTRACKTLHIIAKEPSKRFREGVEKGKSPDPGNFSELLYQFCGCLDNYVAGEAYDFSRMPREEREEVREFPASYSSIPLGGRLKPSSDASEFFGEDGAVGPDASARLAGVALHGILSKVNLPEDLRSAVDDAVREGHLSREQGERSYDLLRQAIASQPDWFSSCGRNEVSLFDSRGNEKRPDRVVIQGRSVKVIDYKFGEFEPQYERQVKGYMNIYRQLGYPEVKGYLWFVRTGEIREII